MTNEEYVFNKLGTLGVPNSRGLSQYAGFLRLPEGDLLKRMLDKRKILLVGGGRSPIYKDLKEQGIEPNLILNVDPYTDTKLVEKNKVCKHLRLDFLETDFKNVFDAVYSLWALPAYCRSMEQARMFYKKTMIATAPFGSVRVYPTDRQLAVMQRGVRNNDWLAGRFFDYRIAIEEKMKKRFSGIDFLKTSLSQFVVNMPDKKEKEEINKWCEKEL